MKTPVTIRDQKIGFLLLIVVFAFSIFLSNPAIAQTPAEERQALEAELKILEEKISKYETDISGVQQEKKTLQSQISILQQKIGKLNTQVQQGTLMIKDLGIQIDETGKTIEKASDQLEQTKIKLKASLQALYQEDQKGGLEILLASEKISDFFGNLTNLEILNKEITQTLANVKSAKIVLENEKENLDKQKGTLQKTVSVQTLQKQQSEQNKKQQETILEQTKGKETLYQQYLNETKKRATEIRSRIFEMIGVPQAPNFGQAYEIAKYVNSITGIRPAFLLAVLTQESNIGKNVGQCYLNSDDSGTGTRISTGKQEAKVMKRTDITLFLQITQELGRDPYHTPVSCPIASVGGYGGAMGPAQFIAPTWMAYKDEVKAQTGRPADPWNITDAFLAAGIYLKSLGASSSEWRAAMKYFSGSTWTKYEEFYGNNVIAIAEGYEDDIKAIENGLVKAASINDPSL